MAKQFDSFTHRSSSEIDTMDGHSFEVYCAELLRKNGFLNVEVTKKSGDRGVDITCIKNDEKYAIQCKRFSGKVNRQAVQEIHAGKALYKCDVGVILTNADFTNSAIEDANDLEIELWGSEKFSELNKAMAGYSIIIWAWILRVIVIIALIILVTLAAAHISSALQYIDTITASSITSFVMSNRLITITAGIIILVISGFILYALSKTLNILNKYFVFIFAIMLFILFLWNIVRFCA
ncbi:MAG: restriction endonuclease [Defluviitaleaceae bacterium]|nr:restriction endonuclease [Defluviitaleaceae bacterium]